MEELLQQEMKEVHKGPLEPGVVEEPCGETEVPVQVEPAQYGSKVEARAVLERRLTAQPPLSRACRVVPARQVAGLRTSITAAAGGMAGLETMLCRHHRRCGPVAGLEAGWVDAPAWHPQSWLLWLKTRGSRG